MYIVHIYTYTDIYDFGSQQGAVYICRYMHMYVCMYLHIHTYICMYVCVCVCTHIHTQTHTCCTQRTREGGNILRPAGKEDTQRSTDTHTPSLCRFRPLTKTLLLSPLRFILKIR